MAGGIFDSLYTAYSGLQTSQLAVNVTSNNISNASNPDYTRQKVVIQSKTPMSSQPGDIGTGSEVLNVTRIHDEFVYRRLNTSSTQKEFADFEETTLTEVSKYFPDIQGTGIASSIEDYFNSWQDYANDPSNPKHSIVVAEKAQVLSSAIRDTRDAVERLQVSLDDRIEPTVEEINRLAKEIADINGQISLHEANGVSKANTLRDERDKRETALYKLVNLTVSKSNVTSDMTIDSAINDGTDQYVMQIAGYPLVDGSTYHPVVLNTASNTSSLQFRSVYFEYQDYTQIDITDKLVGGKLGAILDLRGTQMDSTGMPTKGKLQDYIDMLDTLGTTFIENMNNTYANSAADEMRSNKFSALGTEPLSSLDLNYKSGSFDVIVYDNAGVEVAKRTISINLDTDTMNSVQAKINAVNDDNADGNATNDLSSYFAASFVAAGTQSEFSITQTAAVTGMGYKIAIKDSTTSPSNFAGALGLGRLFDGKDATDITLKDEFAQDPLLIKAFSSPIYGDNATANSILQLQYTKVDFTMRNGTVNSNTIAGFYSDTALKVASDTSTAVVNNDTVTAVYTAVYEEMSSISRVSTDEELVNLMKYQASYQASAKVVSTINQMLDTLLGMKQ